MLTKKFKLEKRFYYMNKKGFSKPIAAVLIVLLVIAVVIIII